MGSTSAPRVGVMLIGLAMALAACGSSGGDGDAAGLTGGAPGAGDVGSAAPAAGGGSASGSGPVTVTVEGASYGFPRGACDVADDHVRVDAAMGSSEVGYVDVLWTAGADSSEHRFRVGNSDVVQAGAPAPFELVADSGRTETSWTVDVNGSSARIQARMGDELRSKLDINPEIQYHDVTIDVQCDTPAFGGATPLPALDAEVPAEVSAVPAGVASASVEVAGTTISFDGIACPISAEGINVNAQDGDGDILNVTGPATGADLFLGLHDGTGYQGLALPFMVSGNDATWSGKAMPLGGTEVPMTITIHCP